jgi:hypothetical protein
VTERRDLITDGAGLELLDLVEAVELLDRLQSTVEQDRENARSSAESSGTARAGSAAATGAALASGFAWPPPFI